MRAASNDDDDDSSYDDEPETQQPARLGNWTKGLGGAAKAAARRLGDKALATLEDTLDAAEERLLEPEEQDVTDDGRDPLTTRASRRPWNSSAPTRGKNWSCNGRPSRRA